MKLATLRSAHPDGRLIVVSRDLRKAASADWIVPNLLQAIQQWDLVAPALHSLSDRLNAGELGDAFDFEPAACAAPLPRCFRKRRFIWPAAPNSRMCC